MVSEERFDFTSTAKKRLIIFLVAGLVLSVLGYFTLGSGDHSGGHGHGEGDHAEASAYGHDKETDHHDKEPYGEEDHGTGQHADAAHGESHGHHGSSSSVKRLLSNLWINNVFFAGLAIIGVFFFAIQYAAQAGWSAGIKRIPFAYGSWLPIAFVLMLVVFMVGGHDIFHWTHADLYAAEGGDDIVKGKAAYFFWPLEGGAFPIFWIGRLVIFFAVWYLLFRKLRKMAFAEDLEGGTAKWYQLRKTSAVFLVFFAVSS
ncbi:MAG: quinol:cytochrome C oxidoreductase, partial [Bacteroidota bacterium]